jgi:ABC-2 type transport system ATP-binding protein
VPATEPPTGPPTGPPTAAAIEVRGLRKSYGSLEAVRGINLRVDAGEVFALLGPNGAGKTTTVEVLEGHRAPSGGEVRVLGFDPAKGERAYRERIGIVLQSTGVIEYLTVREVVELHAGYYPRPREVDEVIGLVGLEKQRDRRVNRLSGGQRRRVDLAVALAGDPELLFLDEPTTGFDPSARRQAWDMIHGLTGLGKTIFLTTHYMDEAQLLADRVAVIAGGRIVAEGSPRTLGGRQRSLTTVSFGLPEGTELPDRFDAEHHDGHYRLKTDDPTRLLHELTEWALSARASLEGLEVSRPSLEDVYLRLIAQDSDAETADAETAGAADEDAA